VVRANAGEEGSCRNAVLGVPRICQSGGLSPAVIDLCRELVIRRAFLSNTPVRQRLALIMLVGQSATG